MGIIFPLKKATAEHHVTGEVTLDGSNPTTITFASFDRGKITSAIGWLKGSGAPGLGTSVLTYTVSENVLSIYAWRVTGAGDATLIASTGTETVAYAVTGYSSAGR